MYIHKHFVWQLMCMYTKVTNYEGIYESKNVNKNENNTVIKDTNVWTVLTFLETVFTLFSYEKKIKKRKKKHY